MRELALRGARQLSDASGDDPDPIGVRAEALEEAAPPKMSAEEMENLYFGAGMGGGITPRDLVGFITTGGALSEDQIGPIRTEKDFSLVSVPADQARALVARLRNSRLKGRKVKIRLERFR